MFSVYRGGYKSLAEHVAAALEHFEANVGQPGVVVVNPKARAEAEAVVAALGGRIGDVPLQVRAVGGCLIGEVWIGLVSPVTSQATQVAGRGGCGPSCPCKGAEENHGQGCTVAR